MKSIQKKNIIGIMENLNFYNHYSLFLYFSYFYKNIKEIFLIRNFKTH